MAKRKGMPTAHLTGSRPHMRRQKLSVEGHTAFAQPKDMAFPGTPGMGAAFPQPPGLSGGAGDNGPMQSDAGPAPPMMGPGQ